MLKSLEDYVVEMENRHPVGPEHQDQNQDLWTQLQQKENDLILAAEFGKALLDKNEALKKEHEATVEEYSKKLEVSFHFGSCKQCVAMVFCNSPS